MTSNAERHAALAALFAAHRRYQTRSFPVDPQGRNWKAMKTAENLGWCWFQGPRCAITPDGLRELEPYRKAEPKPSVIWICPVCLDVVEQFDDAVGLPERTSCPTCEMKALAAAERMREENDAQEERKSA